MKYEELTETGMRKTLCRFIMMGYTDVRWARLDDAGNETESRYCFYVVKGQGQLVDNLL